MSNELLRWRKGATSDEWFQLAKLAKTTVGYLDQIAYGNRRASLKKHLRLKRQPIAFIVRHRF